MKNEHITSNLLACAGALMTMSGLLMAVCAEIAYGGILWAAAACMFFAAYHFRQAEDNRKESNEHENE